LYNTIIVNHKELWMLQDTKLFSNIIKELIHKIIIIDRSEKLCHCVTLTQAFTIGTLYKKNVLTMNELSQELGLALSTLTRIIDILVRDKIVVRKPSDTDRRKVCIELTISGKELAKKLNKTGDNFWNEIFLTLPEDKRDETTSILNMLLDALDKAKEKCCT
jgi:DNA-binding MarR family transcriptional regulator